VKASPKRKAAVVVAVLALVAGSVAVTATAQSSKQQTDTLKLITVAYGGGNDAMKSLISDFEAANPGVKIQYDIRPDQQLKDTIRQTVQSSESPDVFELWIGNAFSRYFADHNAVIPLDKYYKQYNWNSVLPKAATSATMENGHEYGVPYAPAPIVFFYRTDLFKKAGLKPPTTYAELVTLMKKLKDTGISPLSIGGKFSWNTMFLTDNLMEHACGSKTWDALRKTLTANWATTPCVAKGFSDLKTWVTDYLPPDFLGLDPNTGESSSLMYAGKAASVMQGPWLVPGLQQAKQDLSKYGVFAFPTGTGRQYAGGENLMISAKSKNPDLAAKFINFIYSKPEQEKYFGKLNSPFSIVSGVKPPAGTTPLSGQLLDFFKNAKSTFGTTDLTMPAEVYGSYFQAQDNVASGKLDPAKAGAIVQKAVDLYKKSGK
jgi:raffinose/stachyose/melibiose transport system substrate-binding protein